MARAETLVSMSMSMNMSMSAAGEVLSLGIPSDLGESTLPMRVPGGYWQVGKTPHPAKIYRQDF